MSCLLDILTRAKGPFVEHLVCGALDQVCNGPCCDAGIFTHSQKEAITADVHRGLAGTNLCHTDCASICCNNSPAEHSIVNSHSL